ncbi:MAG: protein kinase [Desulfarculaceae bacterium]|nr:protein kinase [Desulfarculaceae bacterium]
MTEKDNCWEYMKCGKEPGGANVTESGVCPAALDTSNDGVNSGRCAGRFCWAVAGTMCGGAIQESFAEKRKSCLKCIFYKKVRAEEGSMNIRTKFLRFVQPGSQFSLMNNLVRKRIKQGERFIFQGETAETAYIIQRGACMELVEKQGAVYPVGHRGEGDVVGMISLVTGEPMGYHVESETDMEVWCLQKQDFERIPEKDPDLFEFLTEIVADRFDRKGPIANRIIGKYMITDIIGSGGYSIVYKGVHFELGRPVAVKMMRHHLSMRHEFMENFENEAKVIAGLDHENIIHVFDIESRYKTLFIVYEYLPGESLDRMIKRLKAIPPDLAETYLRQILSAMDYAGGKGLVHRDINPSNVIVSQDDRIKLIDFGLACPEGTDDFHMGGNFYYLAPELIDGEPADFRSDIYSLGVTAFQMVTGRLPFAEKDMTELMRTIREESFPDPADFVDKVPERIRCFMEKACRKNPEERFQTPGRAKEWLKESMSGLKNGSGGREEKNAHTVIFEIAPEKEKEFCALLEEFTRKITNRLGGRTRIQNR